MLASLRRVLATVSSGFRENLFLRTPLIGKSPDEIRSLSRQSEYRLQINRFLSEFAAALSMSRDGEIMASLENR
jgi:hypothetical protein